MDLWGVLCYCHETPRGQWGDPPTYLLNDASATQTSTRVIRLFLMHNQSTHLLAHPLKLHPLKGRTGDKLTSAHAFPHMIRSFSSFATFQLTVLPTNLCRWTSSVHASMLHCTLTYMVFMGPSILGCVPETCICVIRHCMQYCVF